MKKLICSEPKKIGPMTIKNRIVRSATYEKRAAEDGTVTEELVHFYKTLAEGGIGLIITGFAYIHPSGQALPKQIAVDRDDIILGLSKIADIIHNHGDNCKVVAQIGHCARETYFVDNPIDPSGIREPMTNAQPREMTIEEIEETIEAFAQAARRINEAGFDGVQLHSAHGYLLSEFLSSHTNKRKDKYGGTTENRMRIVENIYKRTVELVGTDFPILIKMNADDLIKGGLVLSESKKIAEKFSKLGFAAIEISSGMWEAALLSQEELGWEPAMIPESRINILSKDREAYHLSYAREIKNLIDVPLILIGGIRSLDMVEEILAEGSADFVSLSRPLIREPDLPNKWLTGSGENTCECISCNGCVASITMDRVHCTQKEK